MRTGKDHWITILLSLIFIIGLIVTMSIVVTDTDTPNSFRFVFGFVIFLLLYVLFQIILVIINVRELPNVDIKRRILKFALAFLFMMAVSWITNYFFRPERLGDWDFGAPLGLAFGITFYDLMFYRKKK